uniref:G-protein coupled receptors family 1 profile domain-containing protein n=1 Tax=Biomphalaria glabrata TaxID=6526 RepID=A0A2C9LSH4_BIOGL
MTGTVANVLNVTILARLGFKQSMNYGTMALSLTDLMVSSLQFTSEICLVLNHALEDSAIDFVALGGFCIGWMRYAGLYISGWITALIATERCFCVVFPFHVKHICSKSIYTLILIVIYSFYLGFVIPIIVIERLTWQQVPASTANNSSVKYILTVAVDDTVIELKKLFDSVCVSGFALFSQIILIISTLYMAHALRESSKVRTSFNVKLPLEESKRRPSFLSLKEKRLIVVAVRLAVIILACSVPRYIAIALFATMPTLQTKENLTFSYFLFD